MRHCFPLLWTFLFSIQLAAQAVCPQAPVLSKPGAENIFTEQQEVDLGEVAVDAFAHDIRVIEDEQLVAPLRSIGDRLLRQMPKSSLKHRFFLIDEPYANAFAMPGGRVYVTRKLIAATQNEDELAGVLAHEMGHQLNHDSAVEFSRMFKDVLKVTSLGDRDDIENKFHLLLDTYRKENVVIHSDRNKPQINADEVAVFAVARAGYDPKAVVEFWDRFTERKGRKGNWFSDMFGSPAPETRRLREFARKAAELPSSCIEATTTSPKDEYRKWQDAVLHFDGFGKKEKIPHLLSSRTLVPPLHGEIKRLRFSPDGHYVLAQDEASIFVLQRDPLKVLFRIDAQDALPAHFTPDSQHVVFHTEALRVYRWDIAGRSQESVDDVYIFRGCLRSLLSPDGNVLACFRPDPDNFVPVGIRLIDVGTGETLYDKKDFIEASVNNGRAWSLYSYLIRKDAPAFSMDFSSDGRYFLAGIALNQFGYDLMEKREMKLPGSLKSIMETSFAFLGPDRVIGVDGKRGDDSRIVRVSTGEVLESGLRIGPLAVEAPSSGEYVIVRPLIETPAGVMDLKENKIFLASKTDALDMYDGTWVSERTNGEVALYRRPSTTPFATIMLPRAPLGLAQAQIFSPDLTVLAISDRSRGKIWNLSGTDTFNLAAFHGAYLDNASALVDFSPPNVFRKLRTTGVSEKELRKEEGDKQGDTIARIDLVKPAMVEVAKYQKRQSIFQIGSTYLALLPKDADEHPDRDVTLEMHDFRSGQLLWSRFFKRMPNFGWNPVEDTIVLAWDLSDRGAKDEMKKDPEAMRLAESIVDKDESYFVAAVNARTGKAIARFPIDTANGSFRISDIHPAGSYLIFMDNNNRLLIYDLKGKRMGRFFGKNPAVSSTGVLAAEREPGRIALYELASMSKREELTFEAPVEHSQFSADGQRLGVLTQDQKVFVIDVSNIGSGGAK